MYCWAQGWYVVQTGSTLTGTESRRCTRDGAGYVRTASTNCAIADAKAEVGVGTKAGEIVTRAPEAGPARDHVTDAFLL
jgi:hypothetical protein